jgi:glycogen(starch) synthase
VKVLMTADTVGGVWTYALELANALASRDVEVTLATMGKPLSGDQRAALERSRVERVHESTYALEWMEDPWTDVDAAGDWLLDIASGLQPDLVHLNGYAHAVLPWEAPVLVVAHSDVLSWHEAVRGVAAGREWRPYRDRVAAGLSAADLVAAPTRAMLDELVRLYDPASPAIVIPNGTARSYPRLDKAQYVIAAGRLWDDAKNIAALERVARRLPWPVAVAGDGTAAAGVHALGRLEDDDLATVLARASIFAEPAFYEPFGLAALEAGIAGCALVLGDIPSLREVWGDAALFVSPTDDDELEAALRRLIDDARLRVELAAAARRRAATYTADAMASGYEHAYRRLLSRLPVVTA